MWKSQKEACPLGGMRETKRPNFQVYTLPVSGNYSTISHQDSIIHSIRDYQRLSCEVCSGFDPSLLECETLPGLVSTAGPSAWVSASRVELGCCLLLPSLLLLSSPLWRACVSSIPSDKCCADGREWRNCWVPLKPSLLRPEAALGL